MNNDSLALALDRLKFYARDAVITLSQVKNWQSSRQAQLMASSASVNRTPKTSCIENFPF